jgi:hypothetical protein
MQHVAAAAGSSGQRFQFGACEGVQRMAKVGVPLQKQHKQTYAHTNLTYRLLFLKIKKPHHNAQKA